MIDKIGMRLSPTYKNQKKIIYKKNIHLEGCHSINILIILVHCPSLLNSIILILINEIES